MMKAIRLFTAATALLGLLASCQKEKGEIFNTGDELVPVTLTASLDVAKSKATYNEVDKDYNYQLKPVWEEGVDKIIGFDEASPRNIYTFTVTDVDASTGDATLEGKAQANCNLHLIYLCGAEATSISDGSLAVDYTGQAGDKTMPAVMLADGPITNGTGSFTFHNAGAVIGIKAVKGAPNGSTISKITISGKNLSAATIGLNGGSLKLIATAKADDAIILDNLTGVKVNDDNGTLSTPVFIAVPAGAIISKVVVAKAGFYYSYSLPTPQTLNANQYTYISQQVFTVLNNGPEYVEIAAMYDDIHVTTLKWATQNLAITESGNKPWKGKNDSAVKIPGTDKDVIVGDYFQWAAHVGYCGNATDADKGLLVYTAFNNKGCGDKEDYFTFKSSKSFQASVAPYYSGSSYTKYPSPSSKKVLEITPDNDDVANIILGGTWRMPTSKEIQAMKAATYWESDATDGGVYVYAPKDDDDIGQYNYWGAKDYVKSEALLFIPGGGYGNWGNLQSAGANVSFWSSSLDSSDSNNAYIVNAWNNYDFKSDIRSIGRFVRPVSE